MMDQTDFTQFRTKRHIDKTKKFANILGISYAIISIMLIVTMLTPLFFHDFLYIIIFLILIPSLTFICILICTYQLGDAIKDLAMLFNFQEEDDLYLAGEYISKAMILLMMSFFANLLPVLGTIVSIFLVFFSIYKEMRGYTHLTQGFDMLHENNLYPEKGKKTLRNSSLFIIFTVIGIIGGISFLIISIFTATEQMEFLNKTLIAIVYSVGIVFLMANFMRFIGFFQLNTALNNIELKIIEGYPSTQKTKYTPFNNQQRESIGEIKQHSDYNEEKQSTQKEFCPTCGETIDSKGIYCNYCGSKI